MAPMSIYIGGLNADILYEDLRKEFHRFGNLMKIWVARNPPGFAFINFENDADAINAIKEMHGTMLKGSEIRVEASYGSKSGRDYGFHGSHGGISCGTKFRRVCEPSFVNDFRCRGKGGGIDFLRGGLKYGSCFDGVSRFHIKTSIDQSSKYAWKSVGVLDCAEFVMDYEDSYKYKSADKKRKHSYIENISSMSVRKKKTYVEKSNENVENINSLPEEILIQIFQYFRRDELDCIARLAAMYAPGMKTSQ